MSKVEFELFQASPKALERCQAPVGSGEQGEVDFRCKWPLPLLLVGQSFTVRTDKVRRNALQAAASKYGKAHSKAFTVIHHSEFGMFEVARIR